MCRSGGSVLVGCSRRLSGLYQIVAAGIGGNAPLPALSPASRVRGTSVRWPVSRVLSSACADGWPFLWDACRQAPRATDPDGNPETGVRRPYLVLLPVGLAVPRPFPSARCALAAPFHPCSPEGGRTVLCGAFPGVAPAGGYPAPCLRGARTFLTPFGARPSGHLTQTCIGAIGVRVEFPLHHSVHCREIRL